jgi:hypothetical protein
MKKREPRRRPTKRPKLPFQLAQPYPLELVANIAVQLIAGNKVPNRPNADGIVSGLNLYPDAAESAMRLLEECRLALSTREDRCWQLTREFLLRVGMEKKYPHGIPFKAGLFYITEMHREPQALAVYRAFLREEKLANRRSHPPSPAADETVIDELAELRKRNFTVSSIEEERKQFQDWKRDVYLPTVKKSSGRKGGKKNMKKTIAGPLG